MIRVLVTAVGHRTEHWEGFFRALARHPHLDVHVHVADVSDLAREGLARLERESPRFRFTLSPHLIGEERTGHMASIVFKPGSLGETFANAERPDVIHVIGEAAYLATFQAVRLRNRLWPNVPITLYAAQNVVMRFPFPFPLLERYAYRQVSLALPITPSALAVLRTKGYRGPASIVPLGVDLERFRPRAAAPEGPFTVGFVGRLEPHKGIADLLAASERIGSNLLLVGDGSLRPLVEEAAAGSGGRIELVPWASHSELPALLERMHVLALPSIEVVQRNVLPWIRVPLREQFGRVLVEAMARGVPVVGRDVGEIPFVIGGGGLSFPAGDAEALADSLTALRDRPELAARCSRAALERGREFGWDRIAAQVYDEWSRLTWERQEGSRRAA